MRDCPRCDGAVLRVPFPLWLRPLRVLFPRLRRVRCHRCGWWELRR